MKTPKPIVGLKNAISVSLSPAGTGWVVVVDDDEEIVVDVARPGVAEGTDEQPSRAMAPTEMPTTPVPKERWQWGCRTC